MENTTQQYLKYKDEFKKVCIFKTAAGAAAILAIIFFLFIPSFLVQEKLGGKVILEQSFSLFNEIVKSFGSFGGGKMGFTAVYSIYQIMALIALLAAIGLMCFGIFKNITGILNLENYSLEEYDKIKRGDQKNKGFRRMNATSMLATAVMLEVMYIILMKAMSGFMSSSSEEEVLSVGFATMNAVSWNIMFAIIFFAAYVALTAIAYNIRNKTKIAILKEDYSVNEK